MPLAVFEPPVAPSPGSTSTPKIKLNKAEFGDGYSQANPVGLNHIRRELSVKWDGLEESQKTYIDDFLTAQKGYLTFLYQPYGYEAPVKWTCEDWSVSAGFPWVVNAKFVQSFYVGP